MKKISAIIKEYFGMLPNQGISGFAQELKQLSDEEKLELAQGAARNLGLKQADCDFPLD